MDRYLCMGCNSKGSQVPVFSNKLGTKPMDLRELFSEHSKKIDLIFTEVNAISVGVDNDLLKMNNSLKKVEKVRKNLQVKMREVDEILKELKVAEKAVKAAKQRIEDYKVEVEGVKEDVKELLTYSPSSLKAAAKEHQETCETVMSRIKEIRQISYEIKTFKHEVRIPRERIGSKETTERYMRDHLINIVPEEVDASEDEIDAISPHAESIVELVMDLNRQSAVEVYRPNELVALEDNTLLICDNGLPFVQRVDAQGIVVQKYPPKLSKTTPIQNIAVCQNMLYMLQDKIISTYSLAKPGSAVAQFKPQVVICSFVVPEESYILITVREKGHLVKYDTEKRLTDVVADRLHRPTYLCVCKSQDKQLIAVTEGGTANRITLFGEGYIPKVKIKGINEEPFKWPRGIGLSPRGTLLVADYTSHTVSEFELDGTFLRLVVILEDGINCPMDVAMVGDTIWVSQRSPSVKMFKLL